uniref:F-box domain-containing protein n=1 Tax=Ditylenchus dipsaci TaxID=166011 RepID=A0A915CRH5_9BILA
MGSKSFVLPSETMQKIVAHFSLIDCKDLVLTSKILSSHSLIRLKKYKKLEMKRRKKQKRVDAFEKIKRKSVREDGEEVLEKVRGRIRRKDVGEYGKGGLEEIENEINGIKKIKKKFLETS